jgi:glycosyltransferase involved in cell wall biosynthesis
MAGARHGGAESFFTRLTLALQRAGQIQCVAIRRDAGRVAALAAGGVELVELRFGGHLDVFTRPALRRLARRWRPDLALTWMSRATNMMPDGLCPVVARLGGYYDLRYYRRADHLIGNTKDIVRYIVESGWPAARVHYLPNFVDVPSVAPVTRESLGVPDGCNLALALGRLHENKGFDVLLQALSELPRLHLVIAGEGPERTALTRQIVQLGLQDRVRLVGWRDDAAALMAAADLVVIPSRLEPLGNVIIEAWASRVPVVAAAAAGPRELIRSGETGLLVPLEDAGALAGAIRNVLAGNNDAMIEAAYAEYSSRFTEAKVVSSYRSLIDGLAH